MEIEAKFRIPNKQTFEALQHITRLGPFDLTPAESCQVHDTYFDTPDNRLWTAGYALRRRAQPEGVLITLKGLHGGAGPVQRREEKEAFLPRETTPDATSLAALQRRVATLTAEQPLKPLFRLHQRRLHRRSRLQGRDIVELSLDEVRLDAPQGRPQAHFRVLELELLPRGTEEELHHLIRLCQERWPLEPEPQTKLERALEFYAVEMPPLSPSDAALLSEAGEAPLPLETLLRRYDVDPVHANNVAAQALALFDALASVHRLPPARRALLRTAAQVHEIGAAVAPQRPHRAGERLLLQHPPAELGREARCIVAVTAGLHDGPVDSKRLQRLKERPCFATLSSRAQEEALALAALLRLAVGLESSRSGTTRIAAVEEHKRYLSVKVEGRHAVQDTVGAERRTGLWRHCFDIPLIFEPPEVSTGQLLKELLGLPKETPTEEITLPSTPNIEADDTMAEAARKTFRFHFARMLYHEAGTREGKDIEALHDMRVATRRMRNAARLFASYLGPEMKPFVKDIRRTNRTLGAVRDLDVFWQKTEAYLAAVEEREGVRPDLSPLHAAWSEAHQKARKALLSHLNGERYRRFKQRFALYLQAPWPETRPRLTGKGDAVPHRLRHVAPLLIYQRLAYLRAYENALSGAAVDLVRYHRLRIAAKYFRYTLEYFVEILGPEVNALIDHVKELQDHLGALQDAVVACNLLQDFLLWGTWGTKSGRPTQAVVVPDVIAYLDARQQEIQHRLETFPQVWAGFQSEAFRRLVADTVAVL
ncbi:MAG: CHAD domain-containing protein [Anaerolineae bacterium]